MKPVMFTIAAAAALAVSACATPTAPRDTGNMAYPASLPQGNVGTSAAVRNPDSGNMAYPAPLPQGTVGTTTMPRRGADTNSSQYQPNLPQGQIGTTRTTP